MMRITQPLHGNRGFILPLPLEMLRPRTSFINLGLEMFDQFVRNMSPGNTAESNNDQEDIKAKNNMKKKIK